MTEVPTIRLEDLSDDQIRAYILADNQLALRAGWDNSILAIELQHLMTVDLGFEITVTGFEIPEIDLILQEADGKPENEPEFAPSGPPVTRPGDLWLLGSHRVLCGNAIKEESFTTLLEGRKAKAVFIDPPYKRQDRQPRER